MLDGGVGGSGIGVSEVESGAVMWLTGLNTTLLNTPKAMQSYSNIPRTQFFHPGNLRLRAEVPQGLIVNKKIILCLPASCLTCCDL